MTKRIIFLIALLVFACSCERIEDKPKLEIFPEGITYFGEEGGTVTYTCDYRDYHTVGIQRFFLDDPDINAHMEGMTIVQKRTKEGTSITVTVEPFVGQRAWKIDMNSGNNYTFRIIVQNFEE